MARRDRSPGGGSGAAIVGGVGIVSLAAVTIVWSEMSPLAGRILADIILVGLLAIAGVFFYRASRTSQPREGPDSAVRARLLLAIAFFIAASAFVAVAFDRLTMDYPERSPFELIEFVYVPLALAALVAYPTWRRDRLTHLGSLIDGLLSAVALGFVFYALVLSTIDPMQLVSDIDILAAAAIPAIDSFVFGITLWVWARGIRPVRTEVGLLALGMIPFLIRDVYESYLTVNQNVAVILPTTLLGICAASIMVGAGHTAWRRAQSGEIVSPDDRNQEFLGEVKRYRFAILLPAVPALACLVVIIVVALSDLQLTPLMGFALVLLFGLLILQQIVSARERTILISRLAAREHYFRSLVLGSSDYLCVVAVDGSINYASPNLGHLLTRVGIDRERANLQDLVHRSDWAAVRNAMAAASAEVERSADSEVRWLSDGDVAWRWTETRIRDLTNDSAVRGFVLNARDVHDTHLLQEQLEFDAYHDHLTGLGNFIMARRTLAELGYGPLAQLVTAVLLDLDKFASINDSFGHEFGDKVLRAVGIRLVELVPSPDCVARLSGDEFLVTLTDDHNPTAVIERIRTSWRTPLMVDGQAVRLEASAGVARSSDARNAHELLRNADIAMYDAKERGRNLVVDYDSSMFDAISRRAWLHSGVRHALEASQFFLVFQPIVELSTGRWESAEALLRWQHPEAGLVSPAEFIPVAEESGIIREIDQWVLGAVCQHLAEWNQSGIAVPPINVNISRQDLDPELPTQIARMLADWDLSADSIIIEVTESAIGSHVDDLSPILSAFHRFGIRVALDDFGTGQSSLSQLAHLEFDKVKIDKSFIDGASRGRTGLALLKSIAAVCHSVGLPVVAEGVETEQTRQELIAMDIGWAQGYLFSRPLSAEAFSAQLANRSVG